MRTTYRKPHLQTSTPTNKPWQSKKKNKGRRHQIPLPPPSLSRRLRLPRKCSGSISASVRRWRKLFGEVTQIHPPKLPPWLVWPLTLYNCDHSNHQRGAGRANYKDWGKWRPSYCLVISVCVYWNTSTLAMRQSGCKQIKSYRQPKTS